MNETDDTYVEVVEKHKRDGANTFTLNEHNIKNMRINDAIKISIM